jgi:ATP-dependent DNA ligase
MRVQLRSDGRAVCLRSRPGRDCTEEFPELALIHGTLSRHRVLLDGELVCLAADGSPDLPAYGGGCVPPADKARRHAERWPVTYLAFDLLHLDGRSTRQLPYDRRRELLLELELDGGVGWRTPRHFVGESEPVLAATREHGLEGVVAKRLGSPYLPGVRNGAWVKHKHRRTESFLVTGWTPPERRRPESLLLPGSNPTEPSNPPVASHWCSATAGPMPSADDSSRSSCRRLAAVSASAGSDRRFGPKSPSTAHTGGLCATRSCAISLRSSRLVRAETDTRRPGGELAQYEGEPSDSDGAPT